MLNHNEVAVLVDPAARARAAQNWIDAAEDMVRSMRHVRDQAIAQMRVSGMSQRAVAAECGLTPPRIAQIDVEQGVRSVRVATIEGLEVHG